MGIMGGEWEVLRVGLGFGGEWGVKGVRGPDGTVGWPAGPFGPVGLGVSPPDLFILFAFLFLFFLQVYIILVL